MPQELFKDVEQLLLNGDHNSVHKTVNYHVRMCKSCISSASWQITPTGRVGPGEVMMIKYLSAVQ
jgi:hypothetical protein